jgi:cell division protein FtsL
MVVTGKKMQVIRHGVPIGISSPPSRQVGDSKEPLSEDFLRLLIRLLAATFLIVLILGLFLHWRISKETAELERLTAVHVDLRREHTHLTAQRNELASKPRIAAAAAVRLGLQFPTKAQKHRLD